MKWGCSFVEFEPSPYAPRQVDVVYSTQEDMTFIFWRIDGSVEPDQVRFEYYDPDFEDWEKINLKRAPYSAAPRSCGEQICFQFQLKGELKWTTVSADLEGNGRGTDFRSRAIRSITDEGVYFGALDFRQRDAAQTFMIDPIALDQNLTFDPKRFDLFQELGLTLVRRYEWRLATSSAVRRSEHTKTRCGEGEGEWVELNERILPSGWTTEAHCMQARPIARDMDGLIVTTPFPPSALLVSLDDRYEPPEQIPLTLFFSLSDLLVRSQQRCDLLQNEIIQPLRDQWIDRIPSDRRVDLGDWFPIDPQTQDQLEECDQPFDRLYPTSSLIDQIKREILADGQDDTVIVALYINNHDEALPDQAAQSFQQLMTELYRLPDTHIELVLVTGEGLSLSAIQYPSAARSQTIPWLAREVTPFKDLMEELGELLFPYRTVLFFSGVTPLPLPDPPPGVAPDRFKICALSPDTLLNVVTDGAGTFSRGDVSGIYSYPWGGPLPPYLLIDLAEQLRVPDFEFYRQSVLARYELCRAFCDFPFRAKNGTDYLDWSIERRCQREDEREVE